MVIRRHTLRLGLYAGLVWIVIEAVLFWLLARQFGFMATLLLLTLKGIGGFMLMASQLKQIFGRLALKNLKNGFAALSDAGFLALGGFLIFLPGLIPTLAGLALFAPSVRAKIVGFVKREKNRSPPDGIVTLDPRDWQEIAPPPRPAEPTRDRSHS